MMRMILWLAMTLMMLAVVAVYWPEQLGVVLYKGLLLTLAAWSGYWLDRSVFPYARPDQWRDTRLEVERYGLVDEVRARLFAAAMLRRAIVLAAAMMCVGLAL